VDQKERREIGSLIAVDQDETRRKLMEAFIDADIAAPKEARDASGLKEVLGSADLDLIVMSSHLGGTYVAPLISEVRRGSLGPHPFPIVVVLAESGDAETLREISNCGPDDVIAPPCAPNDLLERINVFLSGDRRPLVVNAGYAGPERRLKSRE
jgi:DNA-binding response OmpR family regulator